MANPFKAATRQAAKLKLAITGPSGSGKTTAALRCARGLVGKKGKIAVIDTENRSASLYADLTAFDVLNLEAPYEHSKFSEAIQAAEAAGYNCVIIDSASHLWEAILDYKAQLDKRGGNGYTNWNEAGGRFREVVDCLLGANLHVISCLRSKMEHSIEKDEKGRTTIRKVGLAPIMRDGIEYEFSAVLDLDMSHQAVSSKDRTRLFDGKIFEVSEETGIALAKWLSEAESGGDGNSTVAKQDGGSTPPASTATADDPLEEDLPMVHASDLEKELPAGSEAKVNAYLIKINWLKAGQTYRDVSADNLAMILKKLDGFLAKAGVEKEVAT